MSHLIISEIKYGPRVDSYLITEISPGSTNTK